MNGTLNDAPRITEAPADVPSEIPRHVSDAWLNAVHCSDINGNQLPITLCYVAVKAALRAQAQYDPVRVLLVDALKACHLQLLQSNNRSDYAEEASQLACAALKAAEKVSL